MSENYEKLLLAHLREQWESAVSAEAADRAAAVSGEAAARAQAVSAEAAARQSADSGEVTARNSAINAAIVAGTYTGDGAASKTISLGFAPKAVILCEEQGKMCYVRNNTELYGGVFGAGIPLAKSGTVFAEVDSNGFTVYKTTSSYLNNNAVVFHYVAVR